MKIEYFCSGPCQQTKEARDFSHWLRDTKKARRCDLCLKDDLIKERIRKSEKERKAKAEALKANETRILVDHSSEDATKKAVETCRKLEAKLDELRIKKEFDYD